jgi:outer membrane protein TolC
MGTAWAAGNQALTVEQLVEIALEVNPQVRAAKARWNSATHAIKQNYVPADPIYSFANIDSSRGIGNAALHSQNTTEAVQFPGKALLQADVAKRNAEIARLTYHVTLRDIRAQTETTYYQYVLDSALADATAERVDDLRRVLNVSQTVYATNRITQADVINAQFDYSAAEQQEEQFRVNAATDKAQLNQLLYRRPDEPLEVERKIDLKPIDVPVDSVIARAEALRQEILEAAQSEQNAQTALKLARMEYLPDFTFGYTFDHYLVPSFAPTPSHTEDHTLLVGFNVPIFFWWKQKEDITKAGFDLEAVHNDARSIENQTRSVVTGIYLQARLATRTAVLYSEYLIPLARRGFEVALIAYQSGKIGFVDISTTQQRVYNSQVSYLQSANQSLAQRVALEQTIGAALP